MKERCRPDRGQPSKYAMSAKHLTYDVPLGGTGCITAIPTKYGYNFVPGPPASLE